jgi:alcohol dehydrogenase (cytochrome c)
MHRAVRGLLGVVALAVAARGTAAQTADSSGQTSVLAGAYTATQARTGEAVFRRICAQCHATTQFQEPAFMRAWAGRTARDLFELIRTQMPQDNPGQLKREEYAAVLAYILELNGFPPGDTALSTDDAALRRVRIERRP